MHLSRGERIASPFLPVYAALGLAAGILLGERLHAASVFRCAGDVLFPPAWRLLLPLPLLALVAWRGRDRRRVLIPCLVVAAVLLGVWRYSARPFEPCFGEHDLAAYNRVEAYGRPDNLEGVVVGYPERRPTYAQYRVQVDALWRGEEERAVAGIALVRTDLEPPFHYGDRLRIQGVPTAPPVFPGFDYRRFLARKDIHTLVRRADITLVTSDEGSAFYTALYAVRDRVSAVLNQLLPEPYAALANGMILGIESGIPRDLYEDFNLTGTSHVIVISGSNIALISGIFLGVFTWIFRGRKRPAVAFTLTGIILYTLLVGADAAVTRAAIMGSLFVVAIVFGRQSTALVSLFAAAVVMLLLNPLTLWDVGFQLSFMATLGLILFSTPIQKRWNRTIGAGLPKTVNNLVAMGLLVTLAAQITTMPLVVYYFGRLSLISFLANFLILPVQPPILVAGGLAALVGLLTPARSETHRPDSPRQPVVDGRRRRTPGRHPLGVAGGQRLWPTAGRALHGGDGAWLPVVVAAAGAARLHPDTGGVATSAHPRRRPGGAAHPAAVGGCSLAREPARRAFTPTIAGTGARSSLPPHHAGRQPRPARPGARCPRLSARRHLAQPARR